MSAMTYRPELDGVRSIAVYLVLLFHAGAVTFAGGYIGVDLFFVLSGFLITGVLLREADERGTFGLGDFYARRVRRLLPAAVVLVVVAAALQLLMLSQPSRISLVADGRSALLYFANWHAIAESNDYFGDSESNPFIHFWSLAIEEQFYIVYPLVLLLILRYTRRTTAWLAGLLGTVALLSILLQIWWAARDINHAYYGTETRIYQLALGALLMVGLREWVRRRRPLPGSGESPAKAPVWTTLSALAGLFGVIAVAGGWLSASPSVRGLLATLCSLVLLAGLWCGGGWVSRLLGIRPLRYLGQISYGTYLWHWPVVLICTQLFEARPVVVAILAGAVATGLAALSAELIEGPIRRSSTLVAMPWRTVAGGLAVSVVAAFVVIPNILAKEARPAIAAPFEGLGRAGVPGLRGPEVPADLDLAAARVDGGPTTEQCTVDDIDACTRVRGEGAHVLLVGDSQSRPFIPVLEEIARRQSLTLSVNVLVACGWQQGLVNLRKNEEHREECARVRGEFYSEVLPRMDVDVVVVMGLARSERSWDALLTGEDGDAPLAALLEGATRETAKVITDAGARLVIIHSMMGTNGYRVTGPDPIECLARARYVGECTVEPPKGKPPVDRVFDELEAADPRISTVDLNGLICPDHPHCAPLIGNTVVWSNADHVTATFLSENRAGIWRRLQRTGAFG